MITKRQREIAQWVAGGLTSQQIADELNVSKKNIDVIIGNMMRKFTCKSRAHLIAHLTKNNLLNEMAK